MSGCQPNNLDEAFIYCQHNKPRLYCDLCKLEERIAKLETVIAKLPVCDCCECPTLKTKTYWVNVYLGQDNEIILGDVVYHFDPPSYCLDGKRKKYLKTISFELDA